MTANPDSSRVLWTYSRMMAKTHVLWRRMDYIDSDKYLWRVDWLKIDAVKNEPMEEDDDFEGSLFIVAHSVSQAEKIFSQYYQAEKCPEWYRQLIRVELVSTGVLIANG